MSAPLRVTSSCYGSAGASTSSRARAVHHAQQARRHIDLLACVVILAIAAALRFWRLEEYLTFLGDQGRDALQVKHILTDGALPLVGPPTTLAGLHFSPAYYYVLAIPMGLFWLSPVAGAGMVAVLGVASVGLVYALTRTWFGRPAAVASALVYAVSSIGIVSARTAWNPNLLPFFALLA